MVYKNVALPENIYNHLQEVVEHEKKKAGVHKSIGFVLTDLILGAHIRMKREQKK